MQKNLPMPAFILVFIPAITCNTAMTQQASAITPPVKTGPEIYALFKSARATRQIWPADFAGFIAEFRFHDNRNVRNAPLDYAGNTDTEIKN